MLPACIRCCSKLSSDTRQVTAVVMNDRIVSCKAILGHREAWVSIRAGICTSRGIPQSRSEPGVDAVGIALRIKQSRNGMQVALCLHSENMSVAEGMEVNIISSKRSLRYFDILSSRASKIGAVPNVL